MADGVWLYGVLDGATADRPGGRGVDPAHPVEIVRHAGLAAVTSRVDLDEFGEDALHAALEDLDRLEALARAHERVLDEALRCGAVVPFRMCTIYEGEQRLRAMLERERESLAAALRRLRGKAEWGVKAFAPAAAVTAPTPRSGVEYLARKRAERDATEAAHERLGATIESVHERLRGAAADAILSPAQDRRLSGHQGEMVLNASYLVADADVAAFHSLVAELAACYGVPLELTGPWPAYHFSE
jgi:Gas vesicle synthesis protein GvpL/GvpF